METPISEMSVEALLHEAFKSLLGAVKDMHGAMKYTTESLQVLSNTQQSLLERVVKLEIKDQDIK